MARGIVGKVENIANKVGGALVPTGAPIFAGIAIGVGKAILSAAFFVAGMISSAFLPGQIDNKGIVGGSLTARFMNMRKLFAGSIIGDMKSGFVFSKNTAGDIWRFFSNGKDPENKNQAKANLPDDSDLESSVDTSFGSETDDDNVSNPPSHDGLGAEENRDRAYNQVSNPDDNRNQSWVSQTQDGHQGGGRW